MLFSRDKIILDLCGGTGAWSRPYADHGYDVRIIDVKAGGNVRTYTIPKRPVYGVLAAPDCAHFARSGALHWGEKDRDGRTMEALDVVAGCCRIILATNPVFWALENPVGRLKNWLGPPVMKFNPNDYGDPYTKRTLLWGRFNWPYKTDKVEAASNADQHNKISSPRGPDGKMVRWNSPEAKELRSVTPTGFADAFFKANR